MRTEVKSFFRGRSIISRVGRLAVFLGLLAAADQLLGRFGIDIVKSAGVSSVAFFSIIVNVSLVLELIFFPSRIYVPGRETTNENSQNLFVQALLGFVRLLKNQGKVTTILHIRDSMSHLLHLLGENKARIALGEAALAASVEADSTLHRAQILIDDLGWAAHLIGNHALAETNIRRGIQLAESVRSEDERDLVLLRLTAAKGYRHLGMIAPDEARSLKFLSQAEEAIGALSQYSEASSPFHDEIIRDRAQIDHARATLMARSLGIEESGTVPANDREAIDRAISALCMVSRAATAFESVADHERLTKALFLEERLHSAVDDVTAALETRAKREKVARSSSVRKL